MYAILLIGLCSTIYGTYVISKGSYTGYKSFGLWLTYNHRKPLLNKEAMKTYRKSKVKKTGMTARLYGTFYLIGGIFLIIQWFINPAWHF